MADKIKSFRDLLVWQRAVDLAVLIYKATEQFPKSEMYGLTNQMRRASVSVASNIAEGYNRSQAELHHFLEISRGSLAELETQLEIAQRIGFLRAQSHADLLAEINTLGRQLNVFYQRVDATLNH
jgi:four helix bundle protein